MEIQITDFTDWRNNARALLGNSIHPSTVKLVAKNGTGDLFCQSDTPEAVPALLSSHYNAISISRDFIERAHWVSHHSDSEKWQLLYGLAWRLIHEDKRLLHNPIDPQIALFNRMFKAVSRDHHKMKAFVRFRSIADFTGNVDSFNSSELFEPESLHDKTMRKVTRSSAKNNKYTDDDIQIDILPKKSFKHKKSNQNLTHKDEHFIAWFEPEHFIVPLVTSFFIKRFNSMSWSLLTPYECAHWHNQQLIFTEGVPRPPLPKDRTETLWLQYYASIFNPARVKVKAMQSEMPKKYWKNLPEAQLIQTLLQRATVRFDAMFNDKESHQT